MCYIVPDFLASLPEGAHLFLPVAEMPVPNKHSPLLSLQSFLPRLPHPGFLLQVLQEYLLEK